MVASSTSAYFAMHIESFLASFLSSEVAFVAQTFLIEEVFKVTTLILKSIAIVFILAFVPWLV